MSYYIKFIKAFASTENPKISCRVISDFISVLQQRYNNVSWTKDSVCIGDTVLFKYGAEEEACALTYICCPFIGRITSEEEKLQFLLSLITHTTNWSFFYEHLKKDCSW